MRMTNKQKARLFIFENKYKICDDCLTKELNFSQRQTVYQVCTQLARDEEIFRGKDLCYLCKRYKKTNWNRQNLHEYSKARLQIREEIETQDDWCWEGNIQTNLVTWLAKNGYRIQSVAHTALRTRGKDIVALDLDGRELWVSVKGYPQKSTHTQARHWYSQAIFDLILYRDESLKVSLGIGLPDGFSTYLNLSKKVDWLKTNLPFQFYWVSQTGKVRIE